MKLQPRAVEAFLRKPDPTIRVAVVYGPDLGLTRERAGTIAKSVCADLSDPFRVAELNASAIAADPARLADEVAAIPFTGGRRLVRVRDGDDSIAAALTSLLADLPGGDGFLLIEAGDLASRSKLRVVAEGADSAVAIPCYVEDERALGEVLGEVARELGLRLDHETLGFLAGQLVGDRRVARGEMEKLALYAGDRRELTLEDARACIGDSAALDPSVAVWAAADGDFPVLDRSLRRLFGEGVASVAILRAAQRHFQRLLLVSAKHAGGASVDSALAALRPPVFFKEKARFSNQVRRWPPDALRQALTRLVDAEADVKSSHMPDETICARVLFQLTSMGRRR